ncbi:hypothetical protein GCM10028801_41360 [Nocardioides maradonensis]
MTTPAALRILDALGEGYRAAAGPLLEQIIDALAAPLDDTDSRIAATPRGWAAVFDLDATPDPAWLGDAIGSRVPGGLTVEEARSFVRDRAYWRRGTPAAIQAAIVPFLTGSRRVTLLERDGSPWHLTVRVYDSELLPGITADDLKAAALTQKPVGIVLVVEVAAGASYDHMRTIHGPTYDDFEVSFPTYDDATNHLPE